MRSIPPALLRADWLFIATNAVLKPLTGTWLLHVSGFDPIAPRLVRSYVLYALAIDCRLPVVMLQYRLRNLAAWAHAEQPSGRRCS